MKDNNVKMFDAFTWNVNSSSIFNDMLFVAYHMNFSISKETQWHTPKKG